MTEDPTMLNARRVVVLACLSVFGLSTVAMARPEPETSPVTPVDKVEGPKHHKKGAAKKQVAKHGGKKHRKGHKGAKGHGGAATAVTPAAKTPA